jgi:genome maintenance exonuclease 1
MRHNPKYNYPKSTRASIDGHRHYDLGEAKLPSVTTILSATQPEEKRKSLEAWRQRVGEVEAARIVDRSSTRGTALHTIIENYLTGQGYLDLTDIGRDAHNMAQTVIDKGLKDRLTEVWGIEPTIYYEGLWAGATDLIGIHDGVPTICDHKQSNKPKRKEWIMDYGMQIAAYSLAFEDMFGEKITKGVNFIITPDCNYQEFVWEGAEFRQCKWDWLKRVDQYYTLQNNKTMS